MSAPTEQDILALREALDDEYRAWATYDQVIADFGLVPPFSNIRDAEARHIDALRSLYVRFGLPFPENPWSGKVERYPDLLAACTAGVAAEIANGAMYERLLAACRHPDVLAVLRRLRDASVQRHLPAFRRQLERRHDGGRGRV